MNAAIKDLAPSMPTRYLRDFFAEKEIAEDTFELMANDGTAHFMPNVVVVEHIAQCGKAEAEKIGNVLRRIDSANGDVNSFLRHIAGALINAAD
jgi:hypothetical protein